MPSYCSVCVCVCVCVCADGGSGGSGNGRSSSRGRLKKVGRELMPLAPRHTGLMTVGQMSVGRWGGGEEQQQSGQRCRHG